MLTELIIFWKRMNTYAILYHLVKSLNCVVYEHILIERVTEEVKRMLTIINVNRVFTQSLMLVLSHFIEAARISLLNMTLHSVYVCVLEIKLKLIYCKLINNIFKEIESQLILRCFKRSDDLLINSVKIIWHFSEIIWHVWSLRF